MYIYIYIYIYIPNRLSLPLSFAILQCYFLFYDTWVHIIHWQVIANYKHRRVCLIFFCQYRPRRHFVTTSSYHIFIASTPPPWTMLTWLLWNHLLSCASILSLSDVSWRHLASFVMFLYYFAKTVHHSEVLFLHVTTWFWRGRGYLTQARSMNNTPYILLFWPSIH